VVFRPLKADVPPLETVALWSNASPDPLVARVLDILRRLGSEKKKANRTSAVKLSSLHDHSTSWDNPRYREANAKTKTK
jgi:hypothetical protein